MKKGLLCAACLAALSFGASATERMYGLASVGYSDSDFGDNGQSSVAYSLALGHQFATQWYVEGGFQSIADEDSGADALKAQGLYLAVLGKAGGRTGELYYKLGVMGLDVQGFQPVSANGCVATDLTGAPEGHCAYDEGIIAGMVGMGFDYHVGLNSMVRLEALYVRGEQDFDATVLSLGFRYNFN